MKNPLKKKKDSDLLVPVLIGAAAVAGLAYLFLSENTSGFRGKLSENLGKGWDTVKDKFPVKAEDLAALKDEVKDRVSSITSHAKDLGDQVEGAAS